MARHDRRRAALAPLEQRGELGHHVLAALLGRLMAAGAVLLAKDRQHLLEVADVAIGCRWFGRGQYGGIQGKADQQGPASRHE